MAETQASCLEHAGVGGGRRATGLRNDPTRKRCLQKTSSEDRAEWLLIVQRGSRRESNTGRHCLLTAGFVDFKYC